MSGYLELPDGAILGVRDGLVLGRVAACDVVIEDGKASRRHARLIVDAGVVEIEDLNSSNGTLLNGKPVERRMLRDGDEVRIGKTVIVYREGEIPGRTRSSGGSGGAAAVFDDDDDLLGSDAPAPAKPSPPSDDVDLLGDDLTPDEPSPRPAPTPAPPPAANVVEFEDEVVEVQQPPPARPAPTRRDDPVIEVRKAAPRGDAKPAGGKAGADDMVASSQRVLQFSKKAGGNGVLGDDLAQMSGGMRALIVLGVIAIGAGVAYGIMTAMQ